MNNHDTIQKSSYVPLAVILSLIFVVSFVASLTDFSFMSLMRYFMGGFFVTFAGFKFLDIAGFVHGYSMYDLLAKRFPQYGYIYPFLEFGLGLLYISWVFPVFTLWATVILMFFGGLGVLQSIRERRRIQCACLGTVIKLPLTKVTLVEDFGMAGMALLMLLL